MSVLKLWDSGTLDAIGLPIAFQPAMGGSAAFSCDSKYLLVASEGNSARLWDVATGQPIGPPLEHEGSVSSVAFSPDGQSIVTTSDSCGDQASWREARPDHG